MQSIVKVVNILFAPVLTLVFASKLGGLTIAGRNAGEAVGGAIAGLIVLVVEVLLTQGPKHSAWLRRWLEPRAAFEGVWLQEVSMGHPGNVLAVFSLDYVPEDDSFSVRGHAYSTEGRRSANWRSTQMFIDKQGLRATYNWRGELLGQPTPDSDKSGLTELELPRPPVFSLAATGEGRVWHIGEESRLKFRLIRVTKKLLDQLEMPFTVRDLRIDDRNEERLVNAFLRRRKTSVS